MTREERRRRRFSEDFRKEQVGLIESGKTTIKEVSVLYEVRPLCIKRWLRKHGKKELPNKIIISNGKEFDRIKELEAENKKLLELVGKQQVELIYKEEILRLAEEKLGRSFEKK